MVLVMAVAASGGLPSACWYWARIRSYERGVAADMSWQVGGVPFRVDCKVMAPDGSPLSGVDVRIHNNSGGRVESTDENGVVQMEMSEPEVDAVLVNNIPVMDRHYAGLLETPVVGEGLQMTIVVKQRRLLGIREGPGDN
jgi:hypothetical protein